MKTFRIEGISKDRLTDIEIRELLDKALDSSIDNLKEQVKNGDMPEEIPQDRLFGIIRSYIGGCVCAMINEMRMENDSLKSMCNSNDDELQVVMLENSELKQKLDAQKSDNVVDEALSIKIGEQELQIGELKDELVESEKSLAQLNESYNKEVGLVHDLKQTIYKLKDKISKLEGAFPYCIAKTQLDRLDAFTNNIFSDIENLQEIIDQIKDN